MGHFGFHKTYEQAKHSFFWEGMKINIQDFVVACDTCQRNKGEMVKIPWGIATTTNPNHYLD
jgi:hypothetical protein